MEELGGELAVVLDIVVLMGVIDSMTVDGMNKMDDGISCHLSTGRPRASHLPSHAW